MSNLRRIVARLSPTDYSVHRWTVSQVTIAERTMGYNGWWVAKSDCGLAVDSALLYSDGIVNVCTCGKCLLARDVHS